MARKKSRERRPRRARPAESYEPAAELSLEEILEEYRAQQQPEPEPEPEPEILDLEPEEESLLTGELTTEEPTDEAPEPPAEEAPPAPEASAGGPPAEKPYPAADTTRKSSVPLAEIEGYDEQDDFYAGFSGENASDDTPEDVFQDMYARMNSMLSDCGFAPLDSRTSFDWMVLYCMCTDESIFIDDTVQRFLSEIFPSGSGDGEET